MTSQEGEKIVDTENDLDHDKEELTTETKEDISTAKPRARRYLTKHMKLYPELYRSDVSIHPSYTTLKNLPYYVVCRRRVQRTKKQIKRQLNRDIMHFAMMQLFAIDSVRIDRVFSVGMPPKTLIVPDLLTVNERRHINELLRDT
ncbi:uncharacterized protein LOC117234648 [Bombus vosnesenskii]|uniref:Uncharacterized protein LOC117234648 n=3 Tax=Pyrobombus TaxID=144703 RepID=A0A6J3KHZ4_9HYME|nr:uncharacterized protein LOC100747924 [Bombus impatiens]XP_033193706.1 uncharacterized protein LOC117158665 [Bombus vancouverensis nearcticus]XP_033351946.1 uncharacterized protein LOC117234648 [Bombus vosnesenskii]